MSVAAETLPGVVFGRLKRYPDVRGSFAEAWRASGGQDALPFAGVQANLSSSARGVLRGLHLHQHQLDRWIVLDGVAFVALVDLRAMISGGGHKPSVLTATLTKDETVVIPAGVAHGFLAVEPLELLYLVTNEYDGTDELGFAWNDPMVAVDWPKVATSDGVPLISDRDRSNPSLSALVPRLRHGGV